MFFQDNTRQRVKLANCVKIIYALEYDIIYCLTYIHYIYINVTYFTLILPI